MDTRLRELERQALTDPDAKLRWIHEKKRLGYRETQIYVATIDVSNQTIELDDFSKQTQEKIASAKTRIPGVRKLVKCRDICHRYALAFSGEGASCCGSYDCYCDNEASTVQVTIYGYKLETDAEKLTREKQEAAQLKRAEREQARRIKSQRDATEAAQKLTKERDMKIYLRLKRQFESQEKVANLLTAIGSEAGAKLKEYSPSYYKGWFWRKSKKLGNRSPEEVYDAGEIELLKSFALKLL
jgi:hypothetical protein